MQSEMQDKKVYIELNATHSVTVYTGCKDYHRTITGLSQDYHRTKTGLSQAGTETISDSSDCGWV